MSLSSLMSGFTAQAAALGLSEMAYLELLVFNAMGTGVLTDLDVILAAATGDDVGRVQLLIDAVTTARGLQVVGSRDEPILLSGPLYAPTAKSSLYFVAGDGEPATVTGIGPAPAGTSVLFICRDGTNAVTFLPTDIGNIVVNGAFLTLGFNGSVTLVCDGVNWLEVSRNGL